MTGYKISTDKIRALLVARFDFEKQTMYFRDPMCLQNDVLHFHDEHLFQKCPSWEKIWRYAQLTALNVGG